MTSQEIEEIIGDIFKGIWNLLIEIGIGTKQIPKKRSRIYTIITMLIVVLVLYRFRVWINLKFIPYKYHHFSLHFEALLIIPMTYLYILGSQWRDYLRSFERIFESVGLYSNLLVEKRQLDGSLAKKRDLPKYIKEIMDGKCKVYYFTSNGISIDDWKRKQQQIENSMDCHIIKFEQEQHTKKFMKVYTIKASDALKDNYRWKDEYISGEDFEIVIGEGLLDKVKINFEDVPHLLVAGETGSGKSVLTNAIIWQIIYKGARVFLVDFKGGLELGHFEDFGPVMWDRKKVMEVLKLLFREHEKRVELFKEKGVKKLSEYNAAVPEEEQLSRCFLIVDEAAELLDKDGADEEEMADITVIEGSVKKLARLARSQGIHIILATQRPDTKVITGQIRNNLPGRISGKMTDKEPSMMALGSTKAVDLPNIKGRFLYKAGVDMYEFQAYFFKTTDIRKGKYVKGKLLTDQEEQARANIKSNVLDIEDAVEDGIIIMDRKRVSKISRKAPVKVNKTGSGPEVVIKGTKEDGRKSTKDENRYINLEEVDEEKNSEDHYTKENEEDMGQFRNYISGDDY